MLKFKINIKSFISAAPTLNINEITTKNGQYYVVWDLVQNGGGKLRKLSLEYGKVHKKLSIYPYIINKIL